jgi:hypothetical protein
VKLVTREEATTVVRVLGKPTRWPEVVGIMTGDCFKVSPGLVLSGVTADNGWPLEEAFAVNFLETLYGAGYAVVKLEDGQ